jgi:hypothetical protein
MMARETAAQWSGGTAAPISGSNAVTEHDGRIAKCDEEHVCIVRIGRE